MGISVKRGPDRSGDAQVQARPFADIQYEAGYVRVRLIGPAISQREAPLIGRAVQASIRAAGARLRGVVIDATDVRLLSSLGLGVCIDARKAAARQGAATVIFGLSGELRNLFRLTKVDRLFHFADSASDLRRALAA